MAEDKDLEAGARLLAFVPLDCIAYLCTAASFIRGPGGDEEIVGRLQVAAGVPATTTSTAMLKAFRAMGIGRVAVVAPYPKPVTERLVDFLERSAVKVVQWDTIECKLAAQRSAITPGDVYRLVRKNDHPDAEAIFISCTGMPTSYVLDVLEQDLGKPVLSANQVTIWHSLLLSKVRAPMDGLGKLLSMFPSCK
jgi:maleate cis-trans isomerase